MPVQPRAGIYAPPLPSGGQGKLQITLVKSIIGQIENQKLTVKALGLRRMHQTVIRPDTPSVRGMVYTVRHLVRVEAAAQDATLGVVKPALAGRGSCATVIRPAGQVAGSQAATGQVTASQAITDQEVGGAAPGGTDATA
jgi:large subunit ribosomal protein L30